MPFWRKHPTQTTSGAAHAGSADESPTSRMLGNAQCSELWPEGKPERNCKINAHLLTEKMRELYKDAPAHPVRLKRYFVGCLTGGARPERTNYDASKIVRLKQFRFLNDARQNSLQPRKADAAGAQMSERNEAEPDRLLKLNEVDHRSYSNASIYRMIRGRRSAPLKLGKNRSAWRLSDIRHWIDSRPQPLAGMIHDGAAQRLTRCSTRAFWTRPISRGVANGTGRHGMEPSGFCCRRRCLCGLSRHSSCVRQIQRCRR